MLKRNTSKLWLILTMLALLAVVAVGNTPQPALSAPAEQAPAWDGNFHSYTIGDLVTFNGTTYRCRQSHTSQPGWDPVSVPALWEPAGPGGPTPTRTRTPVGPTPTRTRTPTGPTRTPTRTPTQSTPPPGGRIFAPYLDTDVAANNNFSLSGNMGNVSRNYTLAFILGRGCTPAWMGHSELNSTIGNMWATQINQLRNAGGNVIIAFGGAAAPELADACTDVNQLAAAYQAVIDRYGLGTIDLDIESFGASIDRRNQALVIVQRNRPGVRLHYTLGVLPTGLTQPQLDVLNSARRFGVRVDLVNIMAMDYGGPNIDMGQAAIRAAQATRGQLNGMGLGSTQLGITPMIGANDTRPLTFTLQDAQETVSWARSNGVRLLAFWSVGRDNGGCPNGTVSPTCSGIAQSQFQFSSIFRGFP